MSVLRRLVGDEQRAIQATPWGEWGSGGTATWAGPSVSTSSATQLLTVYGCNRFICEGISTLPLDVYRKVGDDRVEVAKPRWLVEPTADLDAVSWLTQVLTSLLLAGNAYLLKVWSGDSLDQLVPIDPTCVYLRRERGRRVFYVDGVAVDSYNILHIPGVMFPGSDVGMSPVEAARQMIGAGLSQEEFTARFFGQGLNMSGVVEIPTEMTDEQARVMANTFSRRHSGKSKAHLPAVLTGGAQWKPTGVTNEQAQFLQTRQFTAAMIASLMFQIDPTEFGLSMDKGSSITYANLEQRNARKVQVTFLPWIVRIEKALSGLLAQPRYVKFNVDGLLRGDLKTRYESYATGIGAGFLHEDEARSFEDLPKRDDLKPATPALPPGDPNAGS